MKKSRYSEQQIIQILKEEVLERSRDTSIHNPAGFVRRALRENWVVKP